MALTHELSRKGSPVLEFFETNFPPGGFKALSKGWYEQVRSAPIVCESRSGVDAGTVGTAFDYRARLCWAPLDWRRSAAAAGMMQLPRFGRPELRPLFTAVGRELDRLVPERCGAGLEPSREDRLCRCCYALALYEQFFRAGAAAASSPLLELEVDATADDLLASAPQAAVDDVAAMAELLCTRLVDLVAAPAALNPTFDGSRSVGGADADLVVNHMLVELKTTRQERFERVGHVYQLLGYAFLDYSGKYEIGRLGVYLARRGLLVSWSVTELLESCCVMSDWSLLQERFRDAVARIGREA